MHAIRMIHDLNPRYVLIENVTDFIITPIMYHGVETMLPDVIHQELDNDYDIDIHTIDTDDYGVPQTRDRMIILMTRHGVRRRWTLPPVEQHRVTMEEAIGHLPTAWATMTIPTSTVFLGKSVARHRWSIERR